MNTFTEEQKIENFMQAPILNNFIFYNVMKNEDICKEFLETILEEKIETFTYIEAETDIEYEIQLGIELDVTLYNNDIENELVNKMKQEVIKIKEDKNMQEIYMTNPIYYDATFFDDNEIVKLSYCENFHYLKVFLCSLIC